ncbi:unnamed protein product [Phytophthora lilii]|uniref:Unnamed protein product n=1 Tax=Phytophthora lilii TaxID=2077276 RepID=A0A9W6U5B8_9STRA|nr:unnamed protein product [Phytophthora lilii]
MHHSHVVLPDYAFSVTRDPRNPKSRHCTGEFTGFNLVMITSGITLSASIVAWRTTEARMETAEPFHPRRAVPSTQGYTRMVPTTSLEVGRFDATVASAHNQPDLMYHSRSVSCRPHSPTDTSIQAPMASRFEIPSHFERAQARLSDGLVGLVVPRGKVGGWHSVDLAPSGVSNYDQSADTDTQRLRQPAVDSKDSVSVRGVARSCDQVRSKHAISRATMAALLSLTEEKHSESSRKRSHDDLRSSPPRSVRSVLPAAVSSRRAPRVISEDDEMALRRKRARYEIRREQCRTNQARYRNKQRNMQLRLEEAVKQVRQELGNLKRRRQEVLLAEKTDQSPWTIVAEVFRIAENSFRSPWRLESEADMHNDMEMRKNLAFLSEAFTSDVAVGEITGIDSLIEQWRRYSQYFGDAPRAAECVPTPVGRDPPSKYDSQPPSLYDRLLGQQLECRVSVDFHFDEGNGRVSRLELKIDFLQALFRVLGNLEEVSEACNPSD